jgi:hypothetical protein
MVIIGPTDRAKLRSPRTAIRNAIVDIAPMTPVCTGTISVVPADGEYPEGDYGISLTLGQQPLWEDGKQDMAVIIRRNIGGSLVRVFTGILRRNNIRNTDPTPSLLRIAYRNVGDTGEAEFTNYNIEVNDLVTVYDQRLPKSFVSRIDLTSGIFYKRGDVNFDTSGTYTRQTQYPEPQVNIGTHQVFYVDPGDTSKTLTEDANDSFSWNANDLNYQWQLDFEDLVGATGATEDVEYDLGWHIVNCQVEDQVTGRVKRGYRLRHCIDGITEKAFSQKYTVSEPLNDEAGLLGRSMRFRVEVDRNSAGSADVMEYLYTGAIVIFQIERCYYDVDNVQVFPTAGITIDHYVGYLRDFTVSTDHDRVDIFELNVQSPLEYYAAVPIPPQTIIAANPPQDWTQAHPDLMRVDFFAWYLMEYQVPVNQKLHDYRPEGLSVFKRFSFSSKGSSIQSALREALSYVTGANIGCLSDGTVTAKRFPWYENAAFRTAKGVHFTWQAGDVYQPPDGKPVQYNLDRLMTTGETIGSGIVTGTTQDAEAFTAHAGALAQMQGVGKNTMPGFIGLDADDIRDRVGHEQALKNSPIKNLTFTAMDGVDINDPAELDVDVLDFSTYDPAYTGILTKRMIPYRVSRKWQLVEDEVTGAYQLTCQPTISFIPETTGYRAPIQPVPGIVIPGGWCYTWDFSQGAGDWVAFRPSSFTGLDIAFWDGVNRGDYDNAYWRSEFYNSAAGGYGNNRQGLAIRIDLSPDTVVSQIDFEVNNPFVGSATTVLAGVVWRLTTGVQQNGLIQDARGFVTVSALLPDPLVNRIGIYLAIHSASDVPGQALVGKITARGNGANPFGSNNCV